MRSVAQDHSLRIERAIDWLAGHLDDPLDFRRLSDVACMSPYHFHRIYRALRGETVTDTVRRFRLHRAAVELLAGDAPVHDIAWRAGYGSQEAFTRAFKLAYGAPPARYRVSSGSGPAYQVTIRHTSAIALGALPHGGDYMTLGCTFERLLTIGGRLSLVGRATRAFGIFYDDPAVRAVSALRADACISLPRHASAVEPLEVREIPSGRYAVTLHVGSYAELEHAYEWLYSDWLVHSDEDVAEFPCVEQYLNDWRTVPATDLRTEVWLPLK